MRGSREGLMATSNSLTAQDSTFKVFLFCLNCGSSHESELEAASMGFRRITQISQAGFVRKGSKHFFYKCLCLGKTGEANQANPAGDVCGEAGFVLQVYQFISVLCYSLQISFNLHLRPPDCKSSLFLESWNDFQLSCSIR